MATAAGILCERPRQNHSLQLGHTSSALVTLGATEEVAWSTSSSQLMRALLYGNQNTFQVTITAQDENEVVAAPAIDYLEARFQYSTTGVVETFGPACGDGVIHVHLSETCDDGNTTSGDGCSEVCALE